MSDDWNPHDPDATQVHYDLNKWTFDQQAELAAALADVEVPHAWEGSELIVPEDHEAAVDLIIANLEAQLGIIDEPFEDLSDDAAVSAAKPQIVLADDVPTTEYDLSDWSLDERRAVSRTLREGSIAFRWDADTLLVATTDESIVDPVLDAVEKGEIVIEPADAGTGNDDEDEQLPFETLTTFFLAGERLQKSPLDADGLEELLSALDVADPDDPPYGVDKRLWERTCQLAEELADALAGDDTPDEDEARVVATELHDLLRPYV